MTRHLTEAIRRRAASLLVAGALLTAPAASLQEPPAAELGTDWAIGDAAEHATDPGRLAAAVEEIGALEGVYSVLVVHRGELVAERYFRDGTREKPHNLKSASKSVLSALAGIAAAEGLLDLDRPIVHYLPRLEPGDPAKAAITARHLLTMTSGLEATSYDTYGEWTAGRDWVRGAFDLPLVAEPGGLFQYSTGNTHLLSAVLAAATGMSTREFAESRLFGPLGVEVKGWARDPQGVHIGGNDLSLTPRAMARFGQLFLDRGRFGDRQVVPAEWVDSSTRTGEIGLHQVYGTYRWLWWTDLVYEGAFTAVGYGGQYIYVSPPHDCVVVVTSTLISKGLEWTAKLFELLRDGVLASFPPSAAYYARIGRPPVDPAIDSLERAVERARAEIAALASMGEIDAPELPRSGRTSSRVNLRRGPGTGTVRVRLLERGARIELLERSDGWLRARAGGDEGWIHADYVELENGSWRPPAATLRRDLAVFSKSIRDRLPETAADGEPEGEAERLGRRLAASVGEREELERQVAELEEQLGARDAELERSRASTGALATELGRARDRIGSLEEELADAGAEAGSDAARLADARGEIAELEQSLAEALEERRAQSRQLDGALARIAELERGLAAAEAGRQTLAAELERRDAASSRRAAEAAGARDELAGELELARARISELEEELTESLSGRTALEERLAESRSDRTVLQERLTALEHERQALRVELDTTVEAGADLGAELEAERGRAGELERDLAASRAARSELEERLVRLTGDEAERREAVRREADSRRALNDELDLARSRIADLERSLAAAEEARGELAAAQDRIVSLERQLAAAGRLESERGSPPAALQAAEDVGRAAEDPTGGEADALLQVARARIAALEERLTESATRRAGLESRLEALQAESDRRITALGRSDELRQELAGELAAVRGQLAELQASAAREAEARRVLETQVAELRRQAASTGEALEQAQAGRAGLARRLRAADARIVVLDDNLRTAQRDRSRLVSQISRLSTGGGRQAEAGAALGDELRAADARIQELEGRLRAAEGANLRLSDSLKSLRAEWEELTLLLAEARRGRAAVNGEQEAASRRIAALEARLRAVAVENDSLGRRLAAAERRAQEAEQAATGAVGERDATVAEAVAGRQEMAARLATAAAQIEALERLAAAAASERRATAAELERARGRLMEERSRNESLAVEVEAAKKRIAALVEQFAAALEDAPIGAPPPAVATTDGSAADLAAAAAALVNDWAAAWSSQDLERYLACYASSFQPAGGLGREAWVEQRRRALSAPESIRVELSGLDVELAEDGRSARVRFHQLYSADGRRLATDKLLELVREEGGWRIERELVGG